MCNVYVTAVLVFLKIGLRYSDIQFLRISSPIDPFFLWSTFPMFEYDENVQTINEFDIDMLYLEVNWIYTRRKLKYSLFYFVIFLIDFYLGNELRR